jgi:hypothetical protein
MAEPIERMVVPRDGSQAGAAPHLVVVSKRLWKLVLVVGFAIWLLAAFVTEVTDDHVLVPLVIDVGSFFVPVTMVAFALSRSRKGFLTIEQIALAVLAAGTLAATTTAVLEIYVLPATTGAFLGVAVIEEIGKGAVLLAIACVVPYRASRDGTIVGAGFASFESAGYAVSALLDHLEEPDRQHHGDRGDTCATGAVRSYHLDWTARRRAVRELQQRLAPSHIAPGPDVPRRRRVAWGLGSGLWLVDPARGGRGRSRLANRVAQRRVLVQVAHVRGARPLHRLLRRPDRNQRAHWHALDRPLMADLRTSIRACDRRRR